MGRSLILVSALAFLVLLPAAALAGWAENFDAYANGSSLHGQGGWTGWDNNPAATAFVTNAQAHSVPHSAEIRPTSDLVQQYGGVNTGQWVFTGWSYVPSGGSGDQYLILLNTYNHLGPYNWSLQVHLSQSTQTVVNDFDGSIVLPILPDRWVEVRVEIDFAADQQSTFYGGTLLSQTDWTTAGGGGGVLNLAALDLFSNGSSRVFWDDLSLQPQTQTPVAPATWGGIKAAFKR